MKLYEFDSKVDPESIKMPGMYDASQDEVSKANREDTRKHVLTLKDLNRLKKLRAFRRLESLKDQDSLALIYGQAEGDDEGDF
jgi:hypothetical protein